MNRSLLPSIFWVLGGLLVVASVLFFFAREERMTYPSASSPRPSGTMAFAELLREDGFEVVVTGSPNPQLRATDLVIAYQLGARQQQFTLIGDEPEPGEPKNSADPVASRSEPERALVRHLSVGGRVLLIGLPENFDQGSKSAKALAIRRWNASGGEIDVTGSTQTMTAIGLLSERPPWFNREASAIMPLWVDTDETAFAEVISEGGHGALILAPDGIGTTNRFIAREDNASAFLRLVREVAPADTRIVFAEALFGNVQDQGFISAIGDWANAARWQVVLFVVVVVFTLGRRFGIPIQDRIEQRGARELVDALGDTLDRGRQAGFSLSLIAQDVDLRIRRKFGLTADAPGSERDAVIPPDLAAALREAEAFEHTKIHGPHAAILARRLLAAMSALEGGRPTRQGRRR